MRVDLAAAQKRPAQVHVLHEVPVRRLVVLGPAADGRPGVVDKDVETPISVYCLGHGGLDRVLVRHVYRGARGIRAECTKLLHGGGGLVLVPRGHGDAGVRRGKPLGDPEADAPVPARDDSDFAPEIEEFPCHVPSSVAAYLSRPVEWYSIIRPSATRENDAMWYATPPSDDS